MRVSLCKHSFPCQPPHGSIFRPGDCTGCAITWNETQAELQRQEEAHLLGTSRDDTCPDCRRTRRLYRWQPQQRPWHPPDQQMPVTFLCGDCWNGATNADSAFADALIDAI